MARPVGLTIGSLLVDPPVVLAPMAGVTNRAFRRVCRSFLPTGIFVNEMVTARALVEGNEATLRMLRFDDDERPRSAQLYGTAPGTMGEAVRRAIGDHGVEHVDLNFGCPVPKVTRKGGGAALLARPVLLASIVGAAVRAAALDRVPVTVKFRIGVDDANRCAVRTGLLAEAEGAAAVALHARTAEQRYGPEADWSAIAELKAAVRSIPVLGNGDIWEAGDAVRMLEATGCDGVVIGRGCLGRPWLFAELGAVLRGAAPPPTPRLGEVAAVLRRHAALLVEDQGEAAGIRSLRRQAGWYLQGYPVGAEVRRRVALAESLLELDAVLDGFDPDAELPAEARRLRRGHTDSPRPVHLPDRWLDLADDPTPPPGAEVLVSGG